jgi:hypothetical protein
MGSPRILPCQPLRSLPGSAGGSVSCSACCARPRVAGFALGIERSESEFKIVLGRFAGVDRASWSFSLASFMACGLLGVSGCWADANKRPTRHGQVDQDVVIHARLPGRRRHIYLRGSVCGDAPPQRSAVDAPAQRRTLVRRSVARSRPCR